MEGLTGGAFAGFLKEHRFALNARFAEASRVHPGLDPAAFSEILQQLVDPLVSAVNQLHPECTGSTASALYDLGLDLLGKGLLGPDSRFPQVAQGWKELLPHIPGLISAEPRLVVGSISNALYNLSQVPGASTAIWMEVMRALAPLSSDAPQYLQAGQVAAWRAGLAHFRKDALQLCTSLPPALVQTALCLPERMDPGSLSTLIERMRADPWLHPDAAQENPAQNGSHLKLVMRAGAFRGFGGLFLQPPQVFGAGEHFLVQDGEHRWLLAADVFGATFHRVEALEGSRSTAPFSIDERGSIRLGTLKAKWEDLAGYSTAASNGLTLAVTTPMSFAISLVAAVSD